MSYENAWITLEEVEKYQLDQDYEQSKGHYGFLQILKLPSLTEIIKIRKIGQLIVRIIII